MNRLPKGKIHPELLKVLIARYTHRAHRVVIGPGIGEDATIIDMGDRYLVAKTDPITHVMGEIGHYAVNINANDIAAMGGVPLWFLATLLMPEGSTLEAIERIFSQISRACEELGISYCGGHTEVTRSVNHPVVIGQMLGEVSRSHLKPSSGAQEGDCLIMTKQAAIEATAIIALEMEADLRAHFTPDLIDRAKDYLRVPGLSILKESSMVAGMQEVHALHDPTEGGIATGIFELATASDLGVRVDFHSIPVGPETLALCNFCGIDPLGTFASGSLLLTAAPSAGEEIMDCLRKGGITAARIGVMTPKAEGIKLLKDGATLPLPFYPQDELSRLFG